MIRCLVMAAALGSVLPPASAHRLDEYLQATLFAIEPDRVEALLRLTPGAAVSPAVVAVIDTNRDGAISRKEEQMYAQRVLRDLSLAVDGKAVPLELSSVEFPALGSLTEGLGEIRIRFGAALAHGTGNRRLAFENRHQQRIAAYLVNCLVPDDPGIRIVAQQRNAEQSSYQLELLISERRQ